MKFRKIKLISDQEFMVPQGIQRIDTKSTHGWQVRYHGTKYFSDRTPDGSCAENALAQATQELLSRIAQYPAPVTIQSSPTASKTSNLPSGISGPIIRRRSRSITRIAEFSLVLPRYGQLPHRRTVYIGNENSYTTGNYNTALAKAVELRQKAEYSYQTEATHTRRKAAATLQITGLPLPLRK